MSVPNCRSRLRTRSPQLPTLTTLGKLFKTVFNTGKPPSGYCQDNLLWPLLAEDAADADKQELREFLALQQGEAVVVAKRKRDRSSLPVAGTSSKKVRSDGSKKRSHRRSPVEETAQKSPRHV
ncbi:hypothetical protein C8J55DRAFT_558577 [Lentinula edodes]|uniref:Uncharacterized protein n=1 Tax=Lentinula lateritia TaxID=40482 RepID=A0A9W9AMN9_9AGAR|nr:hypothetical protein C8J55DRAFT_558577 [Lentinula edodes]